MESEKGYLEEIAELIRLYGLEQDPEHVIIPYTDHSGRKKRCYLLKRRFIRIVYSEDQFVDYPLPDAIKATVRYPELPLSEALYKLYGDPGTDTSPPNSP
jgi:hypothetical protein